jgi:hypothetical protein
MMLPAIPNGWNGEKRNKKIYKWSGNKEKQYELKSNNMCTYINSSNK